MPVARNVLNGFVIPYLGGCDLVIFKRVYESIRHHDDRTSLDYFVEGECPQNGPRHGPANG